MKKSRGSFNVVSRRSILLLGVLSCLAAFGFIVWQVGAEQKSDPSRSQVIRPIDDDVYAQTKDRLEYSKDTAAHAGPVVEDVPSATDVLVNNNAGSTGTGNFTQSETDLAVFGNTVLATFNDSGSFATGSHFTGWSRSTDGGATFTDGGLLPNSSVGDAGDPVIARNDTTGRLFFSTLGFNSPGNLQMYRSDDNGATWAATTSPMA